MPGPFDDILVNLFKPQDLAEFGDPEEENRYKGAYRGILDQVFNPGRQERLLLDATEKERGRQETNAEFYGTRSIPLLSAGVKGILGASESMAIDRYRRGEASPEDIRLLAGQERSRQFDRERGTLGSIHSAVAGIPAILGEAAIAAPVGEAIAGRGLLPATGRLAGTTAAMPSMYVPGAADRAAQQGGGLLDPENIGPAFAHGMIMNAILGRLSGKTSQSLAKRAGLGAAQFTAENQAADVATGAVDEFLPEAYKFKTKYGVLGKLLRGEDGIGKDLAVQAVTGAIFKSMHVPPKDRSATFNEALTRYFEPLGGETPSPEGPQTPNAAPSVPATPRSPIPEPLAPPNRPGEPQGPTEGLENSNQPAQVEQPIAQLGEVPALPPAKPQTLRDKIAARQEQLAAEAKARPSKPIDKELRGSAEGDDIDRIIAEAERATADEQEIAASTGQKPSEPDRGSTGEQRDALTSFLESGDRSARDRQLFSRLMQGESLRGLEEASNGELTAARIGQVGKEMAKEAGFDSLDAAREHFAGNRRQGRGEQSKQTTPGDLGKGDDVLYGGLPIPPIVYEKATEWTLGHRRGPDPAGFAMDPDPNMDNPRRLPSADDTQKMALTQLGARQATDAEKATTSHAVARHIAEQTANHWLLTRKPNSDPFPKGTDGLVELADGSRRPLGDVIEAEQKQPGSQPLTDAQREAVKMANSVIGKQQEAMRQEGMKSYESVEGHEIPIEASIIDETRRQGLEKSNVPRDNPVIEQETPIEATARRPNPYFPRPAREVPRLVEAGQKLWGKLTGKPGTKGFFQKGRSYETEAEGLAAGVKYKGFYESLADYIRQTNRSIADHRLANDPLLGGKDVTTPYFHRLIVENKDILKSLDKPERDKLVGRLRGIATQAATGNVFVAPAFKGKEYSPEAKRQIEQMYGERAGKYLGIAQQVAQELKGLVLGPDISYTTMQLQSMLGSNPIRWARTVAKIPEAIFHRDTLNRIADRRPEVKQAMSEIVQSGGSLGTMPDQVGGLAEGKSLIGKIPVVGKGFEAIGRAFSVVMDMAKVELWLANRPKDKAQWPRAVESIENALGQGRMEQLGMTPERAFLERFLLLAPSYYRAHAKLLQQATQSGAPGFIARKQLASLAGVALLTPIAAMYALRKTGQMSEEEMEERLNPARGKFLMVPVKVGDKRAEVGFGGFYLSVLRSLGNAVRYEKGQTGDNPAVRWYRGHAGVIPRMAFDVGTGRDFMGEPVTTTGGIAQNVLPLAAQEAIKKGSAGQRGVNVAASLAGLRSWSDEEDVSYAEKLRAHAKERYGKRYDELTLPQQAFVTYKIGPRERQEQSVANQERGAQAEELRQLRVQKQMPKEAAAVLAEFKRQAPGYQAHLNVNNVQVRLSQEQSEAYEKLLTEEYAKSIAKWKLPMMRNMKPDRRDKYITDMLGDAKERAQARMIKTWNR